MFLKIIKVIRFSPQTGTFDVEGSILCNKHRHHKKLLCLIKKAFAEPIPLIGDSKMSGLW